eukprot:scaffold1211_cov169-Amphora_coffeaeformis.AAC.25
MSMMASVLRTWSRVKQDSRSKISTKPDQSSEQKILFVFVLLVVSPWRQTSVARVERLINNQRVQNNRRRNNLAASFQDGRARQTVPLAQCNNRSAGFARQPGFLRLSLIRWLARGPNAHCEREREGTQTQGPTTTASTTVAKLATREDRIDIAALSFPGYLSTKGIVKSTRVDCSSLVVRHLATTELSEDLFQDGWRLP